MSKLTMDDFSSEILVIANDLQRPVSNLKLRLVMYFTMQELLKDKSNRPKLESIYDEPFLLWRGGPTIETIYWKYRLNGTSPIIAWPEHQSYFDSFNLKPIVQNLLETNQFTLIERYHDEDFYVFNEDQIHNWQSHVEYSLDDIAEADQPTSPNYPV